MLIKSQSKVCLHTRCSVHFHLIHLPDPPFRFLEGLVPRLCYTHLSLLVGFDIQPRMRIVLAIKPVCVHEARAHNNGQLEQECVTPIEGHSQGKIRTLVM